MPEALPRSEFPRHLLKNRWVYRLSYLCTVGLLAALVFTTPRTIARDKRTGKLRPEVTVPACMMLGIAALIYLSVQASDPGYINVSSDGVRMLTPSERRHDKQRVPSKRESKKRSALEKKDGTAAVKPLQREDSGAGVGLKEVHINFEPACDAGEEEEEDNELEPCDMDPEGSYGDDFENEDSSDEEEDPRLDDEVDEELDGQLLGVPTTLLPLRAKYCRHSRRVVATYDHYCLILGTCIGERNHARFWWFLLAQSITIWTALGIVHSGFHDTRAVVSTWVFHNGHALAAAILLWLVFSMVSGLLGFHTFLAMTNMTSYEFMRSGKISYLKGTRDFDLPFSDGLHRNVRFFCCSDGAVAFLTRSVWMPHEWRPFPPIVRDSEDWRNNLWENKYWSCC